MRIIVVSDLHGSIERLELLLELTQADMYIFTGDLLYNPFFSLEELESFYAVQMEVRGWDRPTGASVPLWVRSIMPRLHGTQREHALLYLQLSERAVQSMQQKYRQIERLTAIKPRTPMYFIPGNYDLDLRSTALNSLQLHKATAELPGIRLAGYGGAPVFTSGVPEHLAARFHEDRQQGPGAYSEALTTLLNLDPDIAVTHVPPLGVRDGSPGRAFGSWGIREFMEQSSRAKLLLCGHVHTGWGASYVDGCWVVNSGNFGQVIEGSGYRRGGYFAEVDYAADRGVQGVILKRLERGSIWHLLEYDLDNNGRLREHIIDRDRALQRQQQPIVSSESEAMGVEDQRELQLLEHYNQIKLFLRRFETMDSEKRIDDLRDMVQLARERGTEIALDVLGSLNMGQSTNESDVDAILYIADDPANNRYNPAFWTQLVQDVTGGRYEMDFTDIIDLWNVRKAIEAGNEDDEELQRFVIYRTIGRPVNVRTLRQYDSLLLDAGSMRANIQLRLRQDLEIMTGTYAQNKSLEKYVRRLQDAGVKIPARIAMRVHKYLHTVD